MNRARAISGWLLRESVLYARALISADGFLAVRNRGERLAPAPFGSGYRCEWEWTSELHGPRVISSLGRMLAAQALRRRPIRFGDAPQSGGKPRISFVIGHRGFEREPLLHATLATIAAQQDVVVEAVVIEQSDRPAIKSRLPSWVSYVHNEVDAGEPYNRALTFNIGAEHAASDVLVLHDNDMLVPASYARSIVDLVELGFEAINPKRFIFYLSEQQSQRVCADRALAPVSPESVVQNLEAGGSVAISKDAYLRIGGMDEGFVGWGGEDNEFWERCSLLRRWDYGYACLFHLWHTAQPLKGLTDSPTLRRYRRLSAIPPEERARRLSSVRRQGRRAADPFLDVMAE